ncbi:MAG TPA: adenylosuccinate lyase [Bacteroidales bacterium]|nr:adenylosuccinate lyase [Bacteroidales bacterium]HOH23115.1 adenylosuccinate lyase [Bacteroidales bacterium]HPZ04280.1 adenylosuccinate lyase [Bacteroidales bacterium]HQB75562.1 adenylosuccinate lyase [Bacteroidales bacterium]
MNLNQLTAISPIDGRYFKQVESLTQFFSEFALIRARVMVEIEYFKALCEIPLPQLESVDKQLFPKLDEIYLNFSEGDALRVKEIEKTTNHDVKAVEYFIKEVFDRLGLAQYKEMIHFGLTSQDINNTATPYLLKQFHDQIYTPFFADLTRLIYEKSKEWIDVPLLAHTHGQPASPSSMGKEWYVFYERLITQWNLLEEIPFCGKFGGATGNFNAHHIAYPEVDWVLFGNRFLSERLGLYRLQTTTQIEHYDNMAAYFDGIKRINNILLDLDRDVWTYISMEYFKQQVKAGEVGSSAMPHKVNPIDFENSEGNIAIANALLEGLSAKLPISRLQRDLTDSTVTRNLGVPMGHTLIAIKSLIRGINKLLLNEEAISRDLDNNWAVLAEAIQTILRREGYPEPYEALKALTRGKGNINKEILHQFIDSLDISDAVKEEMYKLTPHNYLGIMPKL